MSGPKTPDNAGENAAQLKAAETTGEDTAGEAVSGSSNAVPDKVERLLPGRNNPKRSQGADYAANSSAFSAPRSRRSLDQALKSASTAESSMSSRIPAGVQNSFFLSQEKNKDKLHRSPEENEERLRKLLGLADKNNAEITTNVGGENSSSGGNLLSDAQRLVHNVDAVAGHTDSEETSTDASEDEHAETDGEPDTEQQVLDDEDTEDEPGSDDGVAEDSSAASATEEDHVEEAHNEPEPAQSTARVDTAPAASEQQVAQYEVQPRRRDWSNYTTEGTHSRVESFVRGFHALIGIERRKVIQQLKLVTEEDLLETEQLLEEASAELEKYSGYEDLSAELEEYKEYKELAENNAAAYDELQEQLTMLMDHCEQREAYIQQLREELSQSHGDLSTANDLLGSVDSALISIDTQKYPNIVLGKDYSGLVKIVADAEHAGESVTETENDNTASSGDNESEIESEEESDDAATDSAGESATPLIQVPDLPPTTQEDIAQTPEDYSDTLESAEESTEEQQWKVVAVQNYGTAKDFSFSEYSPPGFRCSIECIWGSQKGADE